MLTVTFSWGVLWVELGGGCRVPCGRYAGGCSKQSNIPASLLTKILRQEEWLHA